MLGVVFWVLKTAASLLNDYRRTTYRYLLFYISFPKRNGFLGGHSFFVPADVDKSRNGSIQNKWSVVTGDPSWHKKCGQ